MKIKTGLAAFGLSGQIFHAPFIEAHPDFELTAVAERSKKSAQATYPDVESVDSFEELLRCDVELIVVNTPDATHYPLCRAALEAGKHVIVEKPFVTTIREAKELIEIADRKDLILITYQNRRWDGDFLTLRQIVRQGSLGRLVEIQSSFLSPPSLDTAPDSDNPHGKRHRAPPASESHITCAPTCAIRSSRCWASPRECGQRSTGNATAAGSTTTASSCSNIRAYAHNCGQACSSANPVRDLPSTARTEPTSNTASIPKKMP